MNIKFKKIVAILALAVLLFPEISASAFNTAESPKLLTAYYSEGAERPFIGPKASLIVVKKNRQNSQLVVLETGKDKDCRQNYISQENYDIANIFQPAKASKFLLDPIDCFNFSLAKSSASPLALLKVEPLKSAPQGTLIVYKNINIEAENNFSPGKEDKRILLLARLENAEAWEGKEGRAKTNLQGLLKKQIFFLSLSISESKFVILRC